MKKKLLSVMLALCLACGTAASPYSTESICAKEAQDGEFTTEDGWEYDILPDGTVEITEYFKSVMDNSGIISQDVAVPSQIDGREVSSIGFYAFEGDYDIKSLIIPESVTKIGIYAFTGCKGLESIVIPSGITSIGEGIFDRCTSLKNIFFTGNEEQWNKIRIDSKYNDALANAAIHYDYIITSGGDEDGGTFQDFEYVIRNETVEITDYYGDGGDVVIPSEISGKKVTSIGEWAFDEFTGITSITIPDGVISIGEGAFYECTSLTSITIPDSVTSIGVRAFFGCKSLTSVTIPDSVISIEEGTFYGCKSLTSVTIPDGVTSIGDSAFYGCKSLTSVTIPDGVISIEKSAFSYCKSLTSVTIPDSVTSIEGWAFYECKSLTSITIPDGVTSIGDSAFSGCTSLETINVGINNTSYSSIDGIVYSKNKKELIMCPEGKKGSVTIPDSVTSIGDSAFFGCTSLTSVTIPDGVTSIGDSAFYGCTSLTSITIPNSVTSIGTAAFYGCTSLTSANIPASVTKIYSIFRKCTNLTSITIPDSITSIGVAAFEGCTSLTSANIPASVTEIEIYAFSYCEKLKDIYYNGTKEQWQKIYIHYETEELGADGNTAILSATIHFSDGTTVLGSEIENPANPGTPTTPTQPNDPATPEKPSQPGKPSTPSQPDNPSTPSTPSQPDNPSTPGTPSQPGNPYVPPVTPSNPYIPPVTPTPDTPAVTPSQPVTNPVTPTTPTVTITPDNTEPADIMGKTEKKGLGGGGIFTSGNNIYQIDESDSSMTVMNSSAKGNVTVPATVRAEGKTYKVTGISSKAFSGNKKIKKITIGANVQTISKNAFKGCTNLKEISIKSTKIKSVGTGALKGINPKATIKVPAGRFKAYKKLFKGKGQGKKVRITK